MTYIALGLVLFYFGTLLGVPHGLSKNRQPAAVTELWRIAHLSTCIGGVSLIALSDATASLFPGDESAILIPFSLSAYLFFLTCTLSGIA